MWGAFLAKNMENVLILPNSVEKTRSVYRTAMDTTFVLFFLAMDLGTSIRSMGIDVLITAMAAVAFIILPYFLLLGTDKPEFSGWAIGRVFIAVIGFIAGITWAFSVGTVLPDTFRYLPMTFLILAGIFCASVQICGILKFRLAS